MSYYDSTIDVIITISLIVLCISTFAVCSYKLLHYVDPKNIEKREEKAEHKKFWLK